MREIPKLHLWELPPSLGFVAEVVKVDGEIKFNKVSEVLYEHLLERVLHERREQYPAREFRILRYARTS